MTEQRKASDSSRAAKVVLQLDNNDTFVVACVHIISGQNNRKITGKTPEKRDIFKAACVAHVIDQTFKAAERYPSSKAAIICGDLNARRKVVHDAANAAVADTRLAVIGIDKDFIISSWECHYSDLAVVRAHDGAHSAVNAWFAQAPSASKKRSTQSMTEEPKSKRQQGLHPAESCDVHDDDNKAVVNSMPDAGQPQATGGSSFLARG